MSKHLSTPEERPTAVGKYIDLYREHCATTPMLNNQECEVIERLAEWARTSVSESRRTTKPVCYVLMNAAGQMYWDEDGCVWSHPGDAEETLTYQQHNEPEAGWRAVPLATAPEAPKP